MARGIDVYTRYQKVYDWHAVHRAGQRFVWIKVSDGNSNRDDGGYTKAAQRAGLAVGGYHYAQFGDPVAQANRLCDRVEALGATDLRPALDLEDPFAANAEARSFAIRFLRQVEKRGHRPCIYANNSMLTALLPGIRAEVPDVAVWAARYASLWATQPSLRPSVRWDVHQFSQNGRVAGITGGVDLNDGAVLLNTRKGGGAAAPSAPTARRSRHDVSVPMPPGKSRVAQIPAAGLPPYLYIGLGYGREMKIHELTAIGPTPGATGAKYLRQWRNLTWKADRPGPFPLPKDTRMVSIRYTLTGSDPATGYVG